MTNDAPAEPPSPWPPLPTLIKSSFYSDKHSHVIYIETMPRPGLWGEININYSNPLPPPPSTSLHLHHCEGLETFSSGGLRRAAQPSPARPPGQDFLSPVCQCLQAWAVDCVDCRYWQIFRERRETTAMC